MNVNKQTTQSPVCAAIYETNMHLPHIYTSLADILENVVISDGKSFE